MQVFSCAVPDVSLAELCIMVVGCQAICAEELVSRAESTARSINLATIRSGCCQQWRLALTLPLLPHLMKSIRQLCNFRIAVSHTLARMPDPEAKQVFRD